MIKALKVVLYQNICIAYMKLSSNRQDLVEDAFLASSEAVKLD